MAGRLRKKNTPFRCGDMPADQASSPGNSLPSPVAIISTEIAAMMRPIKRVTTCIPVFPSRREITGAARNASHTDNATSATGISRATWCSTSPLAAEAATITWVIAPGPASNGIPSGTTPTASRSSASTASSRVCRCGLTCACTIDRASNSSSRPPATENAARRMPKNMSSGSPAKVNSVSTPSTVSAAMRAAAWLCARV